MKLKKLNNVQHAGDVGAGKRDSNIEDEGAQELHPNLKLIGRDKAHAFRKVLQRPYCADDFLEALMNDHILGSHSMTQIISNSHEFSLWLEEEISRQEQTAGFGANCKNLRSAKHRFESHSTPLGRMLLYCPAFLATCQKIAEIRKDNKEGRCALAYLQSLTPEGLCQLGMLGDAGDEGLLLVRAMDKGNVDMAEISTVVHSFQSRIGVLFQQSKVVECGYTHYILELLRSGSLCIFLPDAVKKFRGVSRDMLERCLARMRCWARLAVEVLRAEFPHHSLFNAMQVFSLKTEREQACEISETTNDNFHRLAQVFDVNATALRDQLLRHRPVAEQMMREGGLKSRDAWLRAMQRLSKSGSPSDHLSPVMWRYIAWQATGIGDFQFWPVGRRRNTNIHIDQFYMGHCQCRADEINQLSSQCRCGCQESLNSKPPSY